MFTTYIVSALRNIANNKAFSAINILGLAIALAACILILLFVRAESGYEQEIPQADRLVRLHTSFLLPNNPAFHTVRSAGKMREAVANFAKNEVEDSTHLIPYPMTVINKGEPFTEDFSFVNKNFFEMFELPFTQGDSTRAFDKPGNLVISERIALKYFGKNNPIGESITVCCFRGNEMTFPITGVIKVPENTHLQLDFVVRIQPSIVNQVSGILDTWTSVNVYTYFKLREGIHYQELNKRITYWVNNESPFLDMFTEHTGSAGEDRHTSDHVQHRVMPIPDIHLHAKSQAGTLGDMRPLGDASIIKNFIMIAGLILIIACINFINLTTARASVRAKEVGIRKTLGASQGQIVLQFIVESICLLFIALPIALSLVEILLPLYNATLGMELHVNFFNNPGLFGIIVASTIFIGAFSGAYPALILSRLKPSRVLTSTKGAESSASTKIRNVLVIAQFTISITLLACTGVIYSQTQFTQSAELGYSIDNKLVINVRGARDSLPSLKHQLQSLPGITSVAFSSEAPSQDNENNNFYKLVGSPNTKQALNLFSVGQGFFEAYQITPQNGRVFSEDYPGDKINTENPGTQENPGNASVVLNVSATQKLGFALPQDAIGSTISGYAPSGGEQNLRIVGVIPDIRFRSVKFDVRPSIYLLNPARSNVATINYTNSNTGELLEDINRIWKNIAPMSPLNIQYLPDMIAAQYQTEVTHTKIFTAFSLLAIFVACLGLYGLITFAAQRRGREISIRKVMGAKTHDIVSLLLWQFSKPVLVANLFAWPTVIYFMTNWLENFPYRIDFYIVLIMCALSALLSLVISCVTVGSNAAVIANARPIKALRYE